MIVISYIVRRQQIFSYVLIAVFVLIVWNKKTQCGNALEVHGCSLSDDDLIVVFLWIEFLEGHLWMLQWTLYCYLYCTWEVSRYLFFSSLYQKWNDRCDNCKYHYITLFQNIRRCYLLLVSLTVKALIVTFLYYSYREVSRLFFLSNIRSD